MTRPHKKCDYCPAEGTMPTFITGETICYKCLKKREKYRDPKALMQLIADHERQAEELNWSQAAAEAEAKRGDKLHDELAAMTARCIELEEYIRCGSITQRFRGSVLEFTLFSAQVILNHQPPASLSIHDAEVLEQFLNAEAPQLDDKGLDCEQHYVEYAIYCERKRLHEAAAKLHQPPLEG